MRGTHQKRTFNVKIQMQVLFCLNDEPCIYLHIPYTMFMEIPVLKV